MEWLLSPNATPDMLGFVPSFLSGSDTRTAREQMDDNYAHGGGWAPFGGSKWKLDMTAMRLTYDGDPPCEFIACARLRDELIIVFDSGPWMVIVQPDKSFEVSRID